MRGLSLSELATDITSLEDEPAVIGDISISIDPKIPQSIPSAITQPKKAFSLLQLIPKAKNVSRDVCMSEFTGMRHLADGTNANVFLVQWRDSLCVLKMIREEKQHDPVALHEFEMELGLLERIDHPNVVNILGRELSPHLIKSAQSSFVGAGSTPRVFLVLEFLSGGTMKRILSEAERRSPLLRLLFPKPAFTFKGALLRGREMALGLQYLHSALCRTAVFVHRDLKPDNIAFNASGCLVLFDLGLSTLVARSQTEDDTYSMTGQTGSLRYMAPEVMLCREYNEKVDVYSFAVILWQMATGKIPYDGATKDEFIKFVGKKGYRPELSNHWPKSFKDLLVACWNPDFILRPAFGAVVGVLDRLILEEAQKVDSACLA